MTPAPASGTPLDAEALRALAARADTRQPCPACDSLRCPGWESLPSTFDTGVLEGVGTLRTADPDIEPTLDEWHPAGTHGWSPDAPIAPAFHPYNRCTVWRCRHCARLYLRYTEYGGYYQDERVRQVDPARVDATAA
ncbi:MAG: hypothetical protein RL223_1330 [Pseudomonadota bacterium]|jgi:hypothetical protein